MSDLVKSNRLSLLKFLNKNKVDRYVKDTLRKKNPGNDQFLMLQKSMN